MKTANARARTLTLRIKPVTAAIAAAMGSLMGVNVAIAATSEIVVSATRRDTGLQDVPYSISAIDAQTLQRQHIDDLSAIARWTPGFYQADQGARDGSRLIIRGINSSNLDDPISLRNSTGDRVATYYGETPVYVDMKLIDIERIEVLRGPQGTLFGSGSLAGTIRYIPNKPDTDTQSLDLHLGASEVSASDDQGKEFDAVINAPIIEGTLALRALLGYDYDAGFIDYNFLVPNPGVSCPEPGYSDPECASDGFNQKADANFVETRSYGLALLWSPTSKLEAMLSWRRQNQNIGGRSINSNDALELIEQNRGITLDAGHYVAGSRFTEPASRLTDIGNLNVVWETDIGTLTSSTSYTSYAQNGRRDQTDLLLDLEPDDYYYYEEFPAFAAFTAEETDDKSWAQEVRLVSDKDDGPWNWIAGVFYQDQDFFQRSQEFTPGYAEWDGFFTTDQGDLEFDAKAFEETREIAIFGELGYAINDRWNVLAGARWFDYELKARTCTAFPIATTGFGGSPDVDDPSNCSPETSLAKADEDDVLFKFSTDYGFSDALTGYFTYTEGYNSGSVNLRVDLESERTVDSEKTRNYELGIKSNWLDERLTVNAAVFYIDWQDIQVQGRTALNDFPIVRNGEEAKSTGLELELAAKLSNQLTAGLTYSYTKAELEKGCSAADITNPLIPCVLPDEPSAKGDRLPGSPEQYGAAFIDFNQPLENGMDVNVNYSITAQSDVLTTIGMGSNCCRDNGEELPGFALHNLNVGLSRDNWNASVYVTNLFDKEAVTGVRENRTSLRTAGSAPDFALRRYWNDVIRPRVVGFDLRFRFK